MKKKRRPYFRLPTPPTAAYDIRSSKIGERDHVEAALADALKEAIARRLAVLFDDLDTLLRVADHYVEASILRAHILADGAPPEGTRYGLAIVPGTALLDPTRWYLLPPL